MSCIEHSEKKAPVLNTRNTWRRAFAVPTTIALALGASLLGASAAHAVPSELNVTSPAVGATTDSRTVTVAGTAIAEANVIIKNTDDNGDILARTTTNTAGEFFTNIAYADDADIAQTIFVTGEKGFSGFDPTATISFALPAANAVQLDTPVAGSITDSRTVIFTGTAPVGSTVTVRDADEELARQNLGNGSTFSIEYTYSDDAAEAQSVVVGGFVGGSGLQPAERQFLLPTVATKTVTLNAPTQGSLTESRTVVFTGTAPVGSTVTVTDLAENELGRQNLGNGNTFAIEVVYAEDAPVAQTVLVGGFVGGSGFDNTVTRDFTLPETVIAEPIIIDAPVITAPVQGEVVVGDRVTFQGTGTPGTDIGVIALPTAELEQLQAELEAALGQSEPEGDFSTFAQPSPQPEPADPTDRIIVGDDGTWSVTLASVPGDYTVVAFAAQLDETGLPVIDPATGLPVVSLPSEPIEFSVVAAAAPAAVTPAAPVSPELAATGTDFDTAPLAAAVLLALAGLALTVMSRRSIVASNINN